MLDLLKVRHGETPEYVSEKYVARYLDRDLQYIRDLELLEGIPYKVGINGYKEFRWVQVVNRLKHYKLTPPVREHPDAKLRPTEIIYRLDIHQNTYLKYVRNGVIPEHKDEYGKFVYMKDYDYFCRNYHTPTLIRYAPSTMKIGEVCVVLGISRRSLEKQLASGNLTYIPKTMRDGRVVRTFTPHHLEMFVNSEYGKKYFKLRKKPFPQLIPFGLAAMYIMKNPRWFKEMVVCHYVRPVLNDRGVSMGYDKDVLERTHMNYWRSVSYGDGLPYYSRPHIKNKFNKTDLWIDTFVVNKCTAMLSKTEICHDVSKLTHPTIQVRGWVKEDVERVVQSGVEVNPKFEIKVIKKGYDRTSKKEYRKKVKASIQKQYKTIAPDIDPIELSLRAAIQKKELEREAHRVNVQKTKQKAIAERNAIRSILNLEGGETSRLTKKDLLRYSNKPENVIILYSRMKNMTPFFSHYSTIPMDCVFFTSDVAVLARVKYKFTVGTSVSRTVKSILSIPPKCVPSWVIIAPKTSVISDFNFMDRLAEVPHEYGVVGPYGYEYLLPDNSWFRCPATYGMYSEFDVDVTKATRVVGSRGIGPHEVEILDGPFIAVRGAYLKYLVALGEYKSIGDSPKMINALICILMKSLGVKCMQLDVSCSMYKHPDIVENTLEWNAAEQRLIKLLSGKKERLEF